MELSNVEVAVCLKALQLAARRERDQGDETMAEAYMAMRRDLFERFKQADADEREGRQREEHEDCGPECDRIP